MKLRAAGERISAAQGRDATLEEIASDTGLSMEEIVLAMEACTEVESLSKPILRNDGTESTLGERIPGEEDAAHYWDCVEFSSESFQEALGRELSGTPDRWFGKTTYTRGGGVECMVIGGKLYTGTELRTALSLRSTAFSVSLAGDSITITTKGFGHRVGMSQYGAQAMALQGKGYREILLHYYPGTVIDKEPFFG